MGKTQRRITNELAVARQNRDLRSKINALETIVAELKRENGTLRGALEHYADASSWPDNLVETNDPDEVRDVYGLDCDGWTVAAEALGYRFLDDGTEVAR